MLVVLGFISTLCFAAESAKTQATEPVKAKVSETPKAVETKAAETKEAEATADTTKKETKKCKPK